MENIKYFVLILLVLQTSLTVLTLRYLNTSSHSTTRYLPSTVVLLVEIVKASLCIIILLVQIKFNFHLFYKHLLHGMLDKPIETFKMLVPSGLYTMQNNLLHVALSHLDAATFQVTYQLKILTTATLSVFLLKRNLSAQKWLALVLLTVGVALVQLPDPNYQETVKTFSRESRLIGLAVVCFSSVTSSFAGVYFELLLKGSSISLWIRNLQMAMFSIIFSIIAVVVNDGEQIASLGFFRGYNTIVFAAIILQAVGGLLVACVVQYQSNIVKAFATSISVVLSTVISHFLLNDAHLHFSFMVGATIVLLSTYLYGKKQKIDKPKTS